MNIEVDEKGCVALVVDMNVNSVNLCLSEQAITRLLELGSDEALAAQKTRQNLVDKHQLNPNGYLINISRFDPLLVKVVRELATNGRNPAGTGISELCVIKVRLEHFLIRLLEYPGSCNLLKEAYNKQGKKEDYYE